MNKALAEQHFLRLLEVISHKLAVKYGLDANEIAQVMVDVLNDKENAYAEQSTIR